MSCILLITFGGVLLSLLFWRFFRVRSRDLTAYKSILENNQKKLDQQISQISIFTKALPNLQSLVLSSDGSESWRSFCLDEARALLRADGASLWRYHEESQELELDITRGTEENQPAPPSRVAVAESELGVPFRHKGPVLTPPSPDKNESVLLVPLFVVGQPWGVCRFVRLGEDPISQRDSDLVGVFFRQLTMTIENRDMVHHREKFYLELVQTLADTLDSRDAALEGQTRSARRLARGIARELDLPEEFIYYLEFAALLHDIGKIAIDEQLLKKPGRLTPQEFEVIKKHPEIGQRILAPVSLLAPVGPMVLYHQEWFNGQGYPEGLRGEEIPLGARIVAVLDAWGAMTCDHPWRSALSLDEAIAEIKKGAGTQFDPKVVEAFLATLEKKGLMF